MGRAEDRKKKKYISKKLTQTQFEKLQGDINKKFVQDEVKSQVNNFKELFSECLIESFKKNGYSNEKVRIILDDVSIIMQRKIGEKRGTTKKRISE